MRVFNFSPGPAALPERVLRRAAMDMLDFDGLGYSVLEMSHRSEAFTAILKRAEARVRRLLDVPPEYKILFLQGGASTQFAMVPFNLLPPGGSADYIHSGVWSGKAIAEARRYGAVRVTASSEADGFCRVPTPPSEPPGEGTAYVHITLNNTIYGTRFSDLPDTGGTPLVADMSSCLFAEPIEVRRFGLIYASAQKNFGAAGLTLAILHEDLAGRARPGTPRMLDYRTHIDAGSRYNTPPVFAIYLTEMMLAWLEEQGGLAEMAARNQAKAGRIYDVLDRSALFRGTAEVGSRSLMNVTFRGVSAEVDREFLALAEARGLHGLRGHRLVGGMRASLYNGVPEAAAEALAECMQEFERGR